MTTPNYRALCAELTDELENAMSVFHHERDIGGRHNASAADAAIDRARAALAEPVPPDAGEAKTLRELALKELDAWSEERNGPGESIICDGLAVRLIRDALAEPEPPSDGEVAELVEWLWAMRELAGEHNPEEQCRYARAADLLSRLAPQPVPEDQELYDYWISTSPEFGCADPVGYARSVLARWGRQPAPDASAPCPPGG